MNVFRHNDGINKNYRRIVGKIRLNRLINVNIRDELGQFHTEGRLKINCKC